jgi:hypothetical protein
VLIFMGVQVFQYNGQEYVAASERDFGIYIFWYTRPHHLSAAAFICGGQPFLWSSVGEGARKMAGAAGEEQR